MIKRQREYWNSLRWWELAMVIIYMAGSAITTKSWLQVIIFVVDKLK